MKNRIVASDYAETWTNIIQCFENQIKERDLVLIK